MNRNHLDFRATARLLRTVRNADQQTMPADDSLGASLSLRRAWFGLAVSKASGLSDTFEQWFALATDVLLHPNFPAENLRIQAR